MKFLAAMGKSKEVLYDSPSVKLMFLHMEIHVFDAPAGIATAVGCATTCMEACAATDIAPRAQRHCDHGFLDRFLVNLFLYAH